MAKSTEAVRSLSSDEEAVMRSLRPALRVLMRKFGLDLVREQQMTSTDYGVLMFLSEAPARTLRLSDLAAGCQQSLSAISRTVGRLEAAGLVQRLKAPNDARSFNAVLTESGFDRLEQAWPTHVASVRRHLFDKLDDVEVRVLGDVLQRIVGDGIADVACETDAECEELAPDC